MKMKTRSSDHPKISIIYTIPQTPIVTDPKYDINIDTYMRMIESGEVKAAKEIHQLLIFVKEKLDDENVVIMSEVIDAAIKNVERHFPFKLIPWEKFIFAFITGVFFKDGTPVFNEFLIMMGRGGGKTAFMSVIEWWLTTKQGIAKYHVDIVATSEDQAKESFTEIWDILESNQKKYKQYFRYTREKIVFKKTNSMLRYRTNNAKTKDGGRQGAVIFDEIHAYPNEDSVKVFTSGLGKKPNPRRFYFTTDGYERDGFLDDLKLEAQMILQGERPNRRTFPFICKLDEAEEVNDMDMWEKANPSIRYFPSLRIEMIGEFEKFEDRPQAKIEFMTKRMNIPMNAASEAIVPWDKIMGACQHELPDLRGRECIGAIDYADTLDFVGVGLLFKVEKKYYWLHHTFINARALEGRNYRIPIDQGVKDGLITILHTETNRPEDIAGWFMEQAKKYQIKMITSDLYRINYLREKFLEYGFDKLEIARSGSKTHTILSPVVDDLYSYGDIAYMPGDFVMRWYTNNTYKKIDGKGNVTFEKIEPKLRKTDGFFALVHALQFRESLTGTQTKYNRKLKTRTY